MIQSIYIKNFKAWRKGVFKPFGSHAVFVGENRSGKTSILEALDYFFNHTKIDASAIADPAHDVEIGVRIDGQNFRRIFDHRTHEAKLEISDADWSIVDSLRYVFVPATGKTPSRIAGELVAAKAMRQIDQTMVARLRDAAGNAAHELISGHSATDASIRVRIVTARAIDVDLGSVTAFFAQCEPGDRQSFDDDAVQGRGIKAREAIHGWQNLRSVVTTSSFPNVILGIDDAEATVLRDCGARQVEELEDAVGQLLITTRTSELLTPHDGTVVCTVGELPGAAVARTIAGAGALGQTFLFVEGQFDLPWYRKAIGLLGASQRYAILPGGGSNVDALFREFRTLGLRCLLIRDGDMAQKANPTHDDYALKRDCVEMYAPKQLLLDCFGIAPVRTKELFFEKIIDNVAGFDTKVRGHKTRFSVDDIKGIIAERIGAYLEAQTPFVYEIGAILNDYEQRHRTA